MNNKKVHVKGNLVLPFLTSLSISVFDLVKNLNYIHRSVARYKRRTL